MKPWIRGIATYTPGRTVEGAVKLSSNENNYGPSPKVIETLKGSVPSIYRYPYKDELVRVKTAEYAGVAPENVIIGNGSDELIDLIVKTFRGPSLGVYPSFSEYGIVSATNGMEYDEVQLKGDFTFPLEEFLKAADKANLLFLCSPNNPTGNIISPKDIEEVLNLGKPTVVDEAYYEFSNKTSLSLLPKYDNLIIIRTFAKAFALAGLRVGYAIASPEVISLIIRTKPPFNVNNLAQEAVLTALDDLEYMRDCVEKIKADRSILEKAISNKFKVFPSEANFLLFDTSPLSAQDCFNKFLDKDFVVRAFGSFKGFPGEYVRVTVGTSSENEILFAALEDL